MRKSNRTRLLVSLLVFAFAGPVSAQVYKWVDENGKVHYSDKKPPDSAGQNVEVVEENPIQNTIESARDQLDADELSEAREQREAEDEAEQKKVLAARAERFQKQNCYTATEYERKPNAGGGTRIVGSKEVKRCRQPIPSNLQSYLPGYQYDGQL